MADFQDKRNQNADVLAYLGRASGRFGALTGTAAKVPGPYSGVFKIASAGADVRSWLGRLEQVMRPNVEVYAKGAVVDFGTRVASNALPSGAAFFNEIGEYIKSRYAQ